MIIKNEKQYTHEELKKEFLQNRIREMRLKKGITQEQLAEKLGVTQAYVSQIERPAERPGLEMLKKITKALKLSSIEDLV